MSSWPEKAGGRQPPGRRCPKGVSGPLHHITLWLWLVLATTGVGPVPQAEVSKEYQLKAVLLWRLGQFTQWPADAFQSSDSPLVIGVIGKNPFGEDLRLAVRGETAHGRRIEVQFYHELSEIKSCHVLYINESKEDRVTKILAELRGRSILTVGDSDGFATVQGGMIRFVAEGKKIKLQINLRTVAAAGLVIDARVIRAAELVEGL